MKRLKTILVLLAMSMSLFACKGAKVEAAADHGVSVNVPAKMDIIFNEDGTASVSDMYLENDSLVPVEVQNIKVSEFNSWKVVPRNSEILVNSKQLSLNMGEKELLAGSNAINHEVAEQSKYDFDLTVKRGAWTETKGSEKALELEMEYKIGTKQFALTLDANGGLPTRVLKVYNGADTNLPEPKKEGYEFDGWQDDNGNVYRGSYNMPIGDVTLKAVWKKQVAYALFTASDGYLTFVKTADVIQKGQTYNGKTVTAVYTGFEEGEYTKGGEVPWFADGTYKNITNVVFKDKIKPISTAYWFYGLTGCGNYDVAKLDTSKVTNMERMYYEAGYSVKDSFIITGMENWDTSQVTNMFSMFEYSAIYATTYNIGNVGKWNVSNVKDMCRTFSAAGMRATNLYIGDLSGWNTGNVETMVYMFSDLGWKSPSVNIGNIGKWNVSKVTNMYGMFDGAGYWAKTFYIGDLSGWDVSNVTDFGCMFSDAGNEATTFNIGNIGKWNVSKAESMSAMFASAGTYSSTFYIGDLRNWNTANVTSMTSMFRDAGRSASWSLNCRNWNVKKVEYYLNFNTGVESKVTEPVWVN